MRWAGYIARMGQIINAYKIYFENLNGRDLKRTNHRWKDNIVMDLNERRWKILDRLKLSQYIENWCAVVNTVMNLRVS